MTNHMTNSHNSYHHQTLASGLSVITVPMPAVQSVTAMVLVNTGSRYEQPRDEGIAHFFEHMVFKGTTKYPTAQQLAATIDALGADFNAFTSKEYTGYYVKAAAHHLPVALDVVSDMLLQPLLRQEDIDRERSVIFEEINMYQDTPMQHIGNLFDQMFFKGSGLEHDVLGQKKTVGAINRPDFVSFIQQWYGLGNMTLILAGNDKVVLSENTKQLVAEAFAKSPEAVRPKDKVSVKKLVSKRNPTSVHQLHVEHKKTEQAHFVLGWPSIERDHKSRYALALLSAVMGGTMSSRLFSEVREKRGLCYYVRSETDFYHDSGMFGASAGVDPKRIEEALEVVIAEFVAATGTKRAIEAKELERAREHVLGSMILSLEDSRSMAQFFGLRDVLVGHIDSPDAIFEKIRAVSLDEVRALAGELIDPDAVRLALIGPYDTPSAFKRFVGK